MYKGFMQEITESASRHAVCAVIVTYNSGPGLAVNVRTIAAQVDQVILVDNGSNEAGARHIADAVAVVPTAQILLLGNNFGIAAALNAGIASACNQGFAWVITLDQDSTPEADMVQRLLATLMESGEQRVAIVGPTLLDAQAHTQLQKSPSHPDAENNAAQPVTLMTSGCLTSVLCWKEVGGFRDDLFIDYVDHEYCLRCTNHGWQLLQSSAVLNHKLGAMRTHYLFGRIAFNATHHSVLRRYYMTRNRMILWVTYGTCHPKWVAFDVRLFFLELIKIILVEKEKFRKIAAIVLGGRDFFFRNLGERTYKLFSDR